MNRAVKDLLHKGLGRRTVDVQIPPCVTGRARANLQRKKRAARAILASGAAAVTAAAVVAAAGPGQGTGGRRAQARTTALVATRAAQTPAAANKVIQTEMIFSAAVPPVWLWTYRSDWRATQSGYIPPAAAQGARWAQGRVNWGTGTDKVGGRRRDVQVDYRHHRWSAGLKFASPPYACTVRLDIVEFILSPPKWPAYVRQGLSCGLFHPAGHAPVNAVQAIRLIGSQTDRHFWDHPHAPGRGPLRVDVTLYVNPRTYLPMLVIWNNRTHHRDGRPWDGTVRDDITALPATPRNIAKANVTFPASFHRDPGKNPFNALLFPYFTSG